MAAVHRFLFDKDFDSEPDAPAQAPSRPAEATARANGQSAPRYSDEEIAEAREEAYQAGYAAGIDAGRQDAGTAAEQAVAAALDKAAAGLGELAERTVASEARRDGEALRLAIALVKKLFPALAERDGMAEVETLISDCLTRVREEPRVVVRTAEGEVEALRARIDALAEKSGFEGKVVLLGDDALAAGDVRVEWADGGCERDTARLWAEVEALIAHALEVQDAGAPAKVAADDEMRRAG